MAQDDLSSWLKAAAENKINQKNTWKATLIDHFSDISQFKSGSKVNFQKAGCTLDGCMKVYSTRVDDVSENAFKLLNIFNQEEETKKKVTKKKSNYLEKNLSNITLKKHETDVFYDPVFSSALQKRDELFLVNVLEASNSGTYLYNNQSSGLIFEDVKFEIECEILPVCDSLKEYKPDENIVENSVNEVSHHDFEFEVDNDNYSEQEEANLEIEAPKEVEVFHETPFGYFKGWAGPKHWKIAQISSKKGQLNRKPKEKFFIDFLSQQDESILYEKSDTTMSRDFIIERRKNRNILPEDYSYEIRDLYKFMVRDGFFAQKDSDVTSKAVESPVEDFNVDFEPEFNNEADLSAQLEKSLVLDDNTVENEQHEVIEGLKLPKSAKKVDIQRLKININDMISNGETRLMEIYKELPNKYNKKEAKDISIHMCFISLLHLANEKGFELGNNGGDICVKLSS